MTHRQWWRDAVIYQVYPRSFADSDGDGVGDVAGIRARLGHLADLGVDAIWLCPWYASPMADAGYDVADYRAIAPVFGTLADAEGLIADAHAAGLRVIIDVVPNHVSDEHAWFRAALAAAPGSPERARFWFRDGRGEHGELPPTDLRSIFGGPAWTRVADGQWYLHLFAAEQPDLNWGSEEVRAEFDDVLRFWLDRGVDGIRVDSAALLTKRDALAVEADHTDLDEVHDVYRRWRAVADSYGGDRVLVGEVWLPDVERFVAYLRPDELHTAFNFEFLGCPWDAAELRRVIDATLASHALVDAPPTWVLSNHDVTRHVTRYGREDTSFAFAARAEGVPLDLDLGTHRARAALLLCLALPGAAYVYQGEELGLWEVEDIPRELRLDPMFRRTDGADPGRDGCRVPLPWHGGEPPFGFSPPGAAPAWLPQPTAWKDHTVAVQTGDPQSMLELYRDALRRRRATAALGDGTLRWLPSGPGVLAFERDPGFVCVVNLSAAPVALPPHAELLLASATLDAGLLPADTAAWLRVEPADA